MTVLILTTLCYTEDRAGLWKRFHADHCVACRWLRLPHMLLGIMRRIHHTT